MFIILISLAISLFITRIPMLQIIGLISAKRVVKAMKKSGDFVGEDYTILNQVTNDYFKKYTFAIFLHSFIVIAVLVAGYFIDELAFWGCLIGVVASVVLALSNEADLRNEFFDTICENASALQNSLENTVEVEENMCEVDIVNKNNFCRKCGAKLAEDSKFCHKCGTKIINLEKKDES